MRRPRRNRDPKGPKLTREEALQALPHAVKGLLRMIGRTIGAARFLEQEAEPRLRQAASRSLGQIEEIANETAESLTRQLHQGKTENGQRRVRER